MLIAYIGIGVLTAALIVLIVLALKWLAGRVTSGIRERSVDLIGCYGELLREKGDQLAELKEEIEEKKRELDALNEIKTEAAEEKPENGKNMASPYSMLNAVERAGTVPYRNRETASVYRDIREGFCYEPMDVIQELRRQEGEQEEGIATRLLEDLDHNTVYRLSALPPEEQYRLLYESVYDEALPLLGEYGRTAENFDVIGFYDFLKQKAASETGRILLILPENCEIQDLPEGIDIKTDRNIIEGFAVVCQNTVYDYCIRESEIG